MARRRRLRIVLALMLAVGSRLVYAIPAQAVAELMAVSHCTQHTGHPSSVPDARRCCRVTSEADTPATMVAPLDLPASHLAALPGLLPTFGVVAPFETPRSTAAAIRDGPPRYLVLLAIRR